MTDHHGTIAAMHEDPGTTHGDHLRRQRALLASRIAHCQAMMTVID
jgi:hypothetical protein